MQIPSDRLRFHRRLPLHICSAFSYRNAERASAANGQQQPPTAVSGQATPDGISGTKRSAWNSWARRNAVLLPRFFQMKRSTGRCQVSHRSGPWQEGVLLSSLQPAVNAAGAAGACRGGFAPQYATRNGHQFTVNHAGDSA
jgi:hypothetical protein